MKKKEPDYIIYTDGGCAVNPGGPGGIGVIIIDTETGEYTEISRGYKTTTNNRMEMTAVLTALEAVKQDCSILLYTDSQYVINCMSGKWSRNKNTDLWKRIDRASGGKDIELCWVRGHNGDAHNERCDELATMGINDGSNRLEDTGYAQKQEYVQQSLFSMDTSVDMSKPIDKRLPSREEGGAMSVQIAVPENFTDEEERPFPGNAKAYAEERGINAACAKDLKKFYGGTNRNFNAYRDLRTHGLDSYSRKSETELISICGTEVYGIIRLNLEDTKDAITAMRWYARGLSVFDSIRKVIVDAEVRANCAGRY